MNDIEFQFWQQCALVGMELARSHDHAGISGGLAKRAFDYADAMIIERRERMVVREMIAPHPRGKYHE